MKLVALSLSERAICVAKERFETAGAAFDSLVRRKKHKKLRVYEYPCCAGYHITSCQSKARPEPRRLIPSQEAE